MFVIYIYIYTNINIHIYIHIYMCIYMYALVLLVFYKVPLLLSNVLSLYIVLIVCSFPLFPFSHYLFVFVRFSGQGSQFEGLQFKTRVPCDRFRVKA